MKILPVLSQTYRPHWLKPLPSTLVLFLSLAPTLAGNGDTSFDPTTRLDVIGTAPLERAGSSVAVLPNSNPIVVLCEDGADGPGGVALYNFFDANGERLDPPVVDTTFFGDPGVPVGIACDPQGRRCYVAISKSIGSVATNGIRGLVVINVESSPANIPCLDESSEDAAAGSIGGNRNGPVVDPPTHS